MEFGVGSDGDLTNLLNGSCLIRKLGLLPSCRVVLLGLSGGRQNHCVDR